MLTQQWKLYIQWIVATATGWILGLIGALLFNVSLIPCIKFLILLTIVNPDLTAIDEVMRDNIGDGIPGQFIGVPAALIYGATFGGLYGAAFGAIGGFLQSLVLRQHIAKTRLWILVSSLGWAAIWSVTWANAWAWGWTKAVLALETSYGLLAAIGLGFLQWLALRQQVPKAYWWIVTIAVTWIIIRVLVVEITGRNAMVSFLYTWLIVGIGNGAITGITLMRLLQQMRTQNGSNQVI